MGGNTTVKTRQGKETKAQSIPLKEIGRKTFVKRFTEVLKKINDLYLKDHKQKLWIKEELITKGLIFNGSTSFIMNDEYNDEEIIKYKPVAGDLDVMIPKEAAKNLYSTLEKYELKEIIPGAKYMGTNANSIDKIGNTLICVMLMTFKTKQGELKVPAQIDFELSDFDSEHNPTDWARFSHSSSFQDTKAGIKAVHHKYLLRAIFGGLSQRDDIILITAKSSHDPNDKKFRLKKMKSPLVRLLQFGVETGVGQGYKEVLDKDGKPLKINGKYVYQEKEKTEKTYEKNIDNIYTIAFGEYDVKEVQKLHSFIGLLELGNKHFNKKQKQIIADRYFDILFGRQGNQVQPIDPDDVNNDIALKSAAFNKLLKEWGLKLPKDFNEVVDVYVQKAFKKLRENAKLIKFKSFIN